MSGPQAPPAPPFKNSPAWIAFHVLVVLPPFAALTLLSLLIAAGFSWDALFTGDMRAVEPALASALVAAAAAWKTSRVVRRIRLMALGWEQAADPALLRKIAVTGGLVAAFSYLAAVKFGELTRKGTEGATRGNLGAIRSALSIYYGDLEGRYPVDMLTLTVAGKYLEKIPPAKTPKHHWESAKVRHGPAPDDSGGWLYDNVPTDSNFGSVWVNCTHTDVRGEVWTGY